VPTSSVNKIQMTLLNKRNEKREMKMISRAKARQGLSSTSTTFLFPEEVKGTKFLMVENRNAAADMRIFIPDLRRVRNISTTQRNQSYMGSDFDFGDLEALDPDKGTHVLAGSETVDGQDCHLVETKLNPNEGAGYSRMRTWIRKDNFVPIKTEYYDKDGNLKKVKTVSDLYKQKNHWVLKTITMRNVQTGHQTVLNIIESKQEEISDSYFSDQFLLQTDRF
jgi:hypothetical protein